ncbi:CRP-like cAMP-binding protein [Deinococcus metalli]|uniref:CRP-like cAMP-binding protein n=1 Tax=Deinococcus metalli TaxID=1141878 RepID=A0A7W8KJA5_9DEIO|nr:Crp/Fnr family transcriptional regulator [Deinococcus metalli]MBB5379226.1 CRP-like cAMP-binding protein [Deinococcus metalli]GHF65556.1 catabolite gene activator [Deinococcus metalli]
MTLTQRLLSLMRLRPAPVPGGVWHLTGTRWSAGLTDEDMQQIGAVCPPRPYRKGERIYHAGDPGGTLYILLDGHVKLSRTSVLGGESVITVCGPDDFFGESFLTEMATTQADATCLSDRAVICPITREQFLEITRRVPTVAILLASILATRVHELQTRLESLSQPVQVRLAQVMLDLASRFGQETEAGIYDLHLELRHEEIASLARASRVSATQAISAWRAQELVLGTRGHYRVNVIGLEHLIEELQLDALQ